jgi:hypothetical protein
VPTGNHSHWRKSNETKPHKPKKPHGDKESDSESNPTPGNHTHWKRKANQTKPHGEDSENESDS